MSSNFTLFSSDVGSQTTGNAFDQDAFSDITLPATSNGSYTDSFSTNPLNLLFSNDDSLRYGAKTLYIKDLVLLQDRALWVQGKPTYKIIWNENCPYSQGYLFGNIQINRNGGYVSIRQAGDGIGLTGVFRKCSFIVTGDTAATATAQLVVDGANTTTVDFSNNPYALNDGNSNPILATKQVSFVNSASNATRDLHDYRLTALQASTLRVVGVIVYSENSGANIDVFPGKTYVNKAQVNTLSGTTLPLTAFSGNLGGNTLYYKTSSGGYSGSVQAAPNIQSIATGSTGTNLLSVTTGQGGSFPVGAGIAAFWGTTGYIGSVVNQSTDTLTVSPTLSFGISGLIYKTWGSGQSQIIGSSQFILSRSFDISTVVPPGFTTFYSDPIGQFRLWGFGFGYTTIDSIWPALVATNTTLGFLQVDGYFSAADVEFVGQGILHATLSVNGFPAYGINAGQTGCLKKTVFTDAGPGWNNFHLSYGTSMGAVGINRINLYTRQTAQGISFGILSKIDTLVNYVSPVNGTVNATLLALGTFKRFFSDELLFQGGWVRGVTATAAGGIHYLGASTNSVLNFNYYGKNFALLGINNASSLAITLDGVTIGGTLNIMNTAATEGFHSVVATVKSGTAIIHGADITRSSGEMVSLTNLNPVLSFGSSTPQKRRAKVKVWGGNGHGGTNTNIRRFANIAEVYGSAITYTDSSGNGGAFTINEPGVYVISYCDGKSDSAASFGISLNSTLLTSSIDAQDANSLLGICSSVTATYATVSAEVELKFGDIIRAHTDGGPNYASNNPVVQFTILKVSDI